MRGTRSVIPAPLREVDRFFAPFFSKPFWPLPSTGAAEGTVWEPPLDLSENGKEYVVRLEFPGATRDDLDVSLDGNLLTLSGKRELHKQVKDEDYLWEERAEGRFVRSLRLPGSLQQDKIDATYQDGVLTVRLPKAEGPIRSRIAIK